MWCVHGVARTKGIMHLLKIVIREHKKGCNCIEPTLAWGNVLKKKENCKKDAHGK
jgi:hypothetical protein